MFVVPIWLTFLVAGMVTLFGAYRIKIAMRSKADDEKARATKGLYSLPRRTHVLFGILYLLLGVFLIAGAFGFRPFS
jgi:uncharacterized membrane protein HdeD (DUF308 family)